ncbi:MAG: acylneuraminate cytidylyltransferase family protein [Neomegalonema sp.]|nr:acylneuraminate cytidylyltransferase family protein [Neomegalonema sp.]
MQNAPSILAVVPARGGSKGLPRKNIAPLAGKPLIAHSIDAAKSARTAMRVMVSTEDAEIATVSAQFGAEIAERPQHLAEDHVRSADVLLDLLSRLAAEEGYRPDLLLLLQPTSPLRRSEHIDAALAQFVPLWRQGKAQSLTSVCEVDHHPMKSLVIDKAEMLAPMFEREMLERPRQSLPRAYRPNGAIYINDVARFIAEERFFTEPSAPYVMSSDASVDIDAALDLTIAEALLRARG